MYQVCLLRIVSVSDYYHFAFLVVSIALLGFGISGSFLYFFTSKIKNKNLILLIFSYCFSVTIFLSYILINLIPFDSFKIAWEIRQVFYLFAYYFSLLLPFFFGGSFIGFVLYSEKKPQITYFYNLVGSAAGSILFIFLASHIGKIGVVIVSTACGIASVLILISNKYIKIFSILLSFFIITSTAIFLFYPKFFVERISPYKSLSAILRIPESKILYTEENNYARVDVVESPSIKSVPGISLKYSKIPPNQLGLTVDGDNLSPITKVEDKKVSNLVFLDYIPISVVYELQGINTNISNGSYNAFIKDRFKSILIIEPAGGLDVLASVYFTKNHFSSGSYNKNSLIVSSKNVTEIIEPEIFVIQNNNLIVKILKDKNLKDGFFVNYWGNLYEKPNINISDESIRNFSTKTNHKFDLIVLSLSDSYHPISSGAYSLNENYIYTVESFEEIINMLKENGIFSVTRWVQVPPSEGLKTAATLIESSNNLKISNLNKKIFAYRSWSTLTILFKKDGFSENEIELLKNKLKKLNFDVVYYYGVKEAETNIYNQLFTTDYYNYFKKIIESSKNDRLKLYNDYYFKIKPATDNCPYFYDFFKFRQIPDILRYFGKSTQPFGGGGYLVLIAAFIIALILAVTLIIFPLRLRGININFKTDWASLIYFLVLGFGFSFVELPLIQKFILILGKPSYSLSIILFSLMLSAGIGSFTSSRVKIKMRLVFAIVIFYIFSFIMLSRYIQEFMISKVLWQRFLYTILAVFPLGFFMGIPFPAGLEQIKIKKPEIVPWLWAVNGSASVIGSIAAVIISIHIGFLFVLGISSFSYLAALLIYEYTFKRL